MSLYDIPARMQRVLGSGVTIPPPMLEARDSIVTEWCRNHGQPGELRHAERFDAWLRQVEYLVEITRKCANKARYASRKEAAHKAKSAARRFGREYRYYHCPVCGEYHLATVKP